MFDSVKQDIGRPCSKGGQVQAQAQAQPQPQTQPKTQPPFTGRRHTLANLWSPFPDPPSGGNESKSVSNRPQSTAPTAASLTSGAATTGRRMSVMDRMRQYMSTPQPHEGGRETHNNTVQNSKPSDHTLLAYSLHRMSPYSAITARICLNTLAIARVDKYSRARALTTTPSIKAG